MVDTPAPTAVPGRRRPAALAAALAGLALVTVEPATAQVIPPGAGEAARAAAENRLRQLRSTLNPRRGGVLALMGYGAIPDGAAGALQISRATAGPEEGDPTLTLSQFGFGFEVSESFPLYLEAYASYMRYDPRAALTGEGTGDISVRWNNFTTTWGIGWDFYLADSLYVTPVLNVAAGYAASDASLASSALAWWRETEASVFSDVHANVWGIGGSLMLTYFNYSPDREIDFQARYTQLRLTTFGDSLPASNGTSTASTLGLWGQYRWPTGTELFGRPLRWVVNGSASFYLGDQAEVMGFSWATKVGAGIEFDVGRWELGAAGLNLSRVRLTASYLYAERNITGLSVGLGFSF